MPNGPLLSPISADFPEPAPGGLPSGSQFTGAIAGENRRTRRTESLDARLLRVNLPALMGQRDAAVDSAIAIFRERPESPECCRDHFQSIAALLKLAENNGRHIISLLTSPDTINREKRLLAYVLLFSGLNDELCSLCRLYELIFIRAGEFFRSTMAELGGGYSDTVKQRLRESGGMFTWELEQGIEHALPRIFRYREYSIKSFSPENLNRYRRAYDSISEERNTGGAAAIRGSGPETGPLNTTNCKSTE